MISAEVKSWFQLGFSVGRGTGVGDGLGVNVGVGADGVFVGVGGIGVVVQVGNVTFAKGTFAASPDSGEFFGKLRIIKKIATMSRALNIPTRMFATVFMVPPWWSQIDGSHHSEP